jgi:hypothetical protein
MIEVVYDLKNGQQFLGALMTSQAITPPEEGWTTDIMIALAGACAMLCECALHKGNRSDHVERLEANIEQARRDITAAIAFADRLASEIDNAEFEKRFETRLKFKISIDGAGVHFLASLDGFKPGWCDSAELKR